MRITHQMLSRTHIGRMQTNLERLAKSNDKMASGRAFNKGYENVPDAARALKVRQMVVDNERYQQAIRDAEGRATAAEDSIRTVVSLMTKVEDRVIYGLNGTVSDDDREKLATEIAAMQDEVLQVMNTQFADKYVFAAAGNADGSPPFSADASGNLSYNGTNVDSIVKNPADGVLSTYDTATGVYTPIPWNQHNYVDIGYGFNMDGDNVDPNSAFRDTYSGVESFGYGLNEDGVPLNAYSLLGSMVNSLQTGNVDKLGSELDAIPDTMNFMLTATTEVGTRMVTLEDTAARLDLEYINLVETQNELEGVDLSAEIINNKEYEMSWLVTLQLGSKILPQTIFEFMR